MGPLPLRYATGDGQTYNNVACGHRRYAELRQICLLLLQRIIIMTRVIVLSEQVGARPGGRCDMRPSRMITDYRL